MLASVRHKSKSSDASTRSGAGPPPPEAGGHSCGRRQPYAGGGRETGDLALFAQLENRTGADEADAGRDALDHAREVVLRDAGFDRCDHQERRPERDEHVRSNSGRLARVRALEPYDRAEERGRKEAHKHLRDLSRVGQAIGDLLENGVHSGGG